MVADGKLPADARINESELARRLQVSRTPLREALARLEAEGFVVSLPRRGYFVRPMDGHSVRDIGQLRAVLEPAALELAGLPTRTEMRRFQRLNVERSNFAGRVDALEERLELHDEWHLALLARCPHTQLLSLIRHLLLRMRPVERAYLRTVQGPHLAQAVSESTRGHARVAACLAAGDLPGAAKALRDNLHADLEVRLSWLQETPPSVEQMRRG